MTTGDIVTGATAQSESCAHATNWPKNPCDLNPGHYGDHANVDGERWHNYGPVDLYEITWTSGYIETVLAHQVTYPNNVETLALFGGIGTKTAEAPRIRMHAEINGRWVLTLQAREEDIRSIRLVTGGEQIPGGAA